MVVRKPVDDKYDNEEIYCRKLGHHLNFKYCRQEQHPLPCPAVKRCWQYKIEIDDFLKESFSANEIAYLDEPHTPKILSILDIVKKAQENTKD